MTLDSEWVQAYEVAVRLLARREHSRVELRDKLIRRGHREDLVEHALVKLVEQDYVSDSSYVEVCVRSRLQKGDGPLKIRAYLQSHGIGNELIDDHLSSEDDFWLKRALATDQKCRTRHRFSPEDATSQRAKAIRARFLKNRGYPASLIARVLES